MGNEAGVILNNKQSLLIIKKLCETLMFSHSQFLNYCVHCLLSCIAIIMNK